MVDLNFELLSKNLKFLIEKNGYKIGTVENDIGVGRGYIANLTNTQRNRNPELKVIYNFARYLDVTIDSLLNYDLSKAKDGDLEYIGFIDKLTSLTEADDIRWVSIQDTEFVDLLIHNIDYRELFDSNLKYSSLFESGAKLFSYSLVAIYKEKTLLVISVKVRGKHGYEIYSYDDGLVKICNAVFGESELYEKIYNLFMKGLTSSRKNRINEQARNIMNLV